MNNKLPNRIRELRKRNNMSGVVISSKLGISTQYLYDIERGKRTLSADMASKLSEIFNTTTDYLLRKTDINLYDWIPSPAEEAEQEELKKSPSFNNEKEFFEESLDLSDEQIKNKFSFTIDGRELSEEEYQRMLAAVRAERLYRKKNPQ
ncbi:helix-turn-helix transcriptional regulator [Paenibacillus larvae]|uniref:DNA binding protein n=1 Tax=Bacteriophage Lily TaxID=1589751 RepID=A0A0C5AN12_9CAUD|nr:helix-turn-helix transcriptional regulator [Paenibacillus larvae]YP_009202247.1 helix-turn-helix domain-containing protein [Bacteriophage Lily]AJK27765.1 DNA binding protein [Bacteriophage Lily]MCY9571893.1 helix-turn-helix transcriptional regulator [Paenibacillus larvae]